MKAKFNSFVLAGLFSVSVAAGASAQDPNAIVGSSGATIASSALEAGSSSVSSSFRGHALEGEADSSLANKTSLSPEEFRRALAAKPMNAPTGIESIIGPDTRHKVANTTNYPNRAVVRILFDTPGGGALCTGWLIGRDTVVTAGHCVSPGNNTGFYNVSTYVLAPGANGASTPYGTCGAEQLFSVVGWSTNGLDDYDYGIIKLACNIGNTTGWFGFFWTSASLKDISEKITGYPGDKPLEQWFSTGKVTVNQVRRTFYKNDTVGGMSGSPVYYNRSPTCSPCSMAIHAYGLTSGAPFSTNNHGTRITKQVFNNLKNIKALP